MIPARSVSALLLLTCAACGPVRLGPDDLIDRDGVTFTMGGETPFTGVAAEPFPDSIDHTDGVTMSETQYVNGYRDGTRTSWHPNGQVRRVQHFFANATQGTVQEWSEEGVLVLEQGVVDGKAEGVARTWFPSGEPESVGEYLSGALNGQLDIWYENGQQRVERSYESGHAHGPILEWYDDGARRVEGMYVRGHVHGEYRRWHPNGQLALEAEYHRGQSVEIAMWDEGGASIPVEPDLDAEPVR